MKRRNLISRTAICLYLVLALVFSVGCTDSKPSTKYSIYVPSRVEYGGGWYNVNNFKSFENGSIEFRCGNQIHRATDFKIHINY